MGAPAVLSQKAQAAMEMIRLFQLQLEHYEKVEGSPLSLEGKANQLSQMVRNHLPAAMQGLAVVPIFAEQLRRGGPLTVTDPEVTRYFMTIPEAARLVLQAQAIGRPGDIFVLEMGEPVRIADLARKMIALAGVPADIAYVGMRPGEKLHEELVGGTETLAATGREKIQRVERVEMPSVGFSERIDALLTAADGGDPEGLREALSGIEPASSVGQDR